MKEFDYSWDDQYPEQMSDLVLGEYTTGPDPEDQPELENFAAKPTIPKMSPPCLILNLAEGRKP